MRSKPITQRQVNLIALYITIAIVRQVAHDLKTLWRLTDPKHG